MIEWSWCAAIASTTWPSSRPTPAQASAGTWRIGGRVLDWVLLMAAAGAGQSAIFAERRAPHAVKSGALADFQMRSLANPPAAARRSRHARIAPIEARPLPVFHGTIHPPPPPPP